MTTQYYAGIGSRKTPQPILNQMSIIAQVMAARGYTLRSGGAAGADRAFERGAQTVAGPMQIFGVQGKHTQIYPHWVTSYPDQVWHEAMKIAALTHPAWNRCSDVARGLHTRNVFQILGPDLQTPSAGVFCWTPDGACNEQQCSRETGGTGQAIRLASRYGLPVYNFFNHNQLEDLLRQLANLN